MRAACVALMLHAQLVSSTLVAQEGEGSADPFGLGAFSLPISGMFQNPDFDFAANSNWSLDSSPWRMDVLFGMMIPNSNSGMAFGKSTSDEDFDTGGIFGFRVQAYIAKYLRFGGEIDFASHSMGQGEVFFPGYLSRLYFSTPLTFEMNVGSGPVPFNIGLSVAPGLQWAFPTVDRAFEDILLSTRGRSIRQDNFVGPSVRAGLLLRVPIDFHMRFIFDLSYDWAYGAADVAVFDAAGRLVEDRSGDIDLSAVNIFAGFTVVF